MNGIRKLTYLTCTSIAGEGVVVILTISQNKRTLCVQKYFVYYYCRSLSKIMAASMNIFYLTNYALLKKSNMQRSKLNIYRFDKKIIVSELMK